jgi:hypothetical protein
MLAKTSWGDVIEIVLTVFVAADTENVDSAPEEKDGKPN